MLMLQENIVIAPLRQTDLSVKKSVEGVRPASFCHDFIFRQRYSTAVM